MYSRKDRELLQTVYAKLCIVEKLLNNEPKVKLAELEEAPSPYLNSDGLYSIKTYKEKRELERQGKLKNVD